MKNTLIKIFIILVGVIIILALSKFAYNLFSEEEINALEVMAENVPENMPEEPKEIKEEKKKEEDVDELIVQECEIEGKKYEVIAILSIPTLEIEYPVLSTTSKELLKVSINKYWGPNPNRPGNFCILGHNYNDDRFFGKLKNIKEGDYVQLTDMTGKGLQYCVYDTYIVDPEDTNCTSQLTNGETELTLITCTRDFKQRFIVKARAEEL